jgi:hypothetical protein
MTKENMINIDNAFKVLKENSRSTAALEILKNTAESIFHYTFNVNVIDVIDDSPVFFMSVYPERSSIDKIVDSITKNESHMISKLWKQTKIWNIEIDKRLFNSSIISLTDRELTAIFCHEIGHIIQSNSIPNRIITILQYELAKASVSNKSLIRDRFFQKILSLPIVNACMNAHDKSSIKDEIKADKFVKSMGYQDDLLSVFKKYKECKKITDADDDMRKMASFTKDSLTQFKKRETALLEYTINEMIKDCNSVYVESLLTEIRDDFFFENANSSVTKDKRLDFLYERAEALEEEFIATEFFGFGKKTLKRIDPAEIDYATIKLKDIKSNSDKMMVVSYIHSKLDIVNYYIALLNNPKQAKKYNIPHSLRELEDLRYHLNGLINEAINAKLPDRFRSGILVAWPDGFEG